MLDEIIELTKDLIRFKTMHSHVENFWRCTEFIEDYLKLHGIQYEKKEHEDFPHLLVNPKAPVMLVSHLDVVYGPEQLFEPVIKDGKLFGRGAYDDKYAVALSMVLLKEHVKRLRMSGENRQDVPFGILITSDEEIGGFNGANRAFETIESDFCIVFDGGSVDRIVMKEKGVLIFKLTATGGSAHSSTPWKGKNAIDMLIEDSFKIKRLFRDEPPDSWHKTINFSTFNAGNSPNQVPDHAEALFDVRYTDSDDIDQLLKTIKRQISCELDIHINEPLFISEKCHYRQTLLSVCGDISFGFGHGASDARFLSKHGINGIVWGADGDFHHSDQEFVTIESIDTLARKMNKVIARV